MDFYETIADIEYHVKNNMSLYGKHDEFKKKYGKLFEMLCDPVCDKLMLKKLLSLHKKVQEGKISQKDADCAFGKVAADKYVSPLVEPTTATDNWTHV